jgi:threonylcarbamoyladenosine tRNA methylthiotransferase MtaB
VIKTRAAQLRAAGDRAVQRHLHAQQGKTHQVLIENPNMGRTEQFAEVHFSTAQPVGQIVETQIGGYTGTQLLGAPAPIISA